MNNKTLSLLIALFFIVGLIGHLLTITRGLIVSITWLTLSIVNATVIYYSLDLKNNKNRIAIICIFLVTFVSEIIGVQTGYIFGEYNYSSVLGPAILGVPLIIGVNWVTITISIFGLMQKTANKISLPIQLILGGLLAVFFDIFLETVAISLNYWKWDNHTPPLQNYIAWFVITIIGLLIAKKFITLKNINIMMYFFAIQTTYFIVLSLLI